MKKIHLLPLCVLGVLAAGSVSLQAADYYWDTNGATAGFGANPRTGTWGTDSFWSTSAAGTVATIAWPGNTRAGSGPDRPIFSGGNGTVTVSGTQTALTIQSTSGNNMTLSGGTISLESGNFGFGVQVATFNDDNNNNLTIDSNISLGADGGSGTREIIFQAGRNGNTAARSNSLTINGNITSALAGRATTLQFRPERTTSADTTTVVLGSTSTITTGSATTMNVEFGTRNTDAQSGRLELRGTANTYNGLSRIGSGTIAVYGDAANNTNGVFGNNANALDLGYGNVNAAGQTTLVTNGARTIAKDINIGTGASSNTSYGVTIGGETADTSTYSGTIALSASGTRSTVVKLTAASGGTVNFSGLLNDGAATVPIEKVGAGTVNLSRAAGNTYDGTTTVTTGTLLVNNTSGSATGTGAVTVASGAILGGSGIITGTLATTGSIRPGNSIGTLNAGSTTWNSGSDWVFELGAANAADLLNITGSFTKGTGSTFRFDFAGGTSLGTFKLVDWSTTTNFVAGDFSYTNLGGGNTGTFAFNGTQLEFTAVPEPATWALLGCGLTILMVFRRRRA